MQARTASGLARALSLAAALIPTWGCSCGAREAEQPAAATASHAPVTRCEQPAAAPNCQKGMCRVKPGCFVMGAPRDEWGAGRHSDVQVQVTLTRAFWIGETEVSRAQWSAAGLALPEGYRVIDAGDCQQDDCPVAGASFFDAVFYANRRSELEQLPACYRLERCTGEAGRNLVCQGVTLTAASAYECKGYRLPTEAEWEYAARAGTSSPFFNGVLTKPAGATLPGDCSEDPQLNEIGWYCFNSQARSHPIGLKMPNGWGLHDTAGNLYEWCNDIFDSHGYGAEPLIDPTGTVTPGVDLTPSTHPAYGSMTAATAPRIMRGGNYVTYAALHAVANRSHAASGARESGIGFRLARSAQD